MVERQQSKPQVTKIILITSWFRYAAWSRYEREEHSLYSTSGYFKKSFIIPPQIPKEYLVRKLLFILFVANILLTACASSTSDAPVKVVEDYLNALVAKDAERLPTLVCGDWEADALIELDSFQAVTASLEDVSCAQTGTDGSTALVNCKGNIVASYNNEDQKLDLSVRTYQVVEEGGEWLVCGTR